MKKIRSFLNRLIKDARWRVRLSLLGSVSLNILYSLMQLASGILYRKAWFYALAVYYAMLIIMRIFLIRDTAENTSGKNLLKEFKRYRLCGFLFVVLTLALAVIVLYVVKKNYVFRHRSLHTVALGTYTVLALIFAAVNTVKYRKLNSPVISAAKAVSLASATVSLLSLETALIWSYGGQNNPGFRRVMTAVTGGAVCLFLMGMAVYMIIRANNAIRKIEGGQGWR